MRFRYSFRALVAVVSLAGLMSATSAHALQVWSGRTFAFSKAALANPTLAANQDRITSNVWITRGSTEGLYNIKQESISGGSLGISPVDTEWANGDAVNHASLVFDTWVNWASSNGGPPGTVGKNACVHLISDDIYVDIRIDSWGVGGPGGGAFSYHRAVSGATPTEQTTWGAIKALYR